MSWYPAPGVRVFQLKAMVTAVAVAFVLGVGLGFGAAWRIYGWKEAATDLVVERAATAVRTKEETRQRAVGARHASKAEVIERTFEEIEHATSDLVAARPELRSIDLGPDVLCVWRAANAGRSTAEARCGPAAAVPAAAGAEGREGIDAVGEPRPDGGAIPPGVQRPLGADRSGLTPETR